MRVAVAGLGGAAVRGHIPALAALQAAGRLAVVGAADPAAPRRAGATQHLPETPLFSTTESMMDRVKSDVLVVATEPRSHADLIELAAEYDVHVVCEKPLASGGRDHDRIAAVVRGHPDLAVVPVHQYQYSPAWNLFRLLARRENRRSSTFNLSVQVDRMGTDRSAASPWRTAANAYGGVLADHGVHYIALGMTVSDEVEVVDSMLDIGRGISRATLRVGSGHLRLSLSTSARRRRNTVRLLARGLQLDWSGGTAQLSGGCVTRRWRTSDLGDRRHVDALYVPLYHELAANISCSEWRSARTANALHVDRVLRALIDAGTSSCPFRVTAGRLQASG